MTQLIDLCFDAQKIGLKLKILTKEIDVIFAVNQIISQGVIDKENITVEISADYGAEEVDCLKISDIDRPSKFVDGKRYVKRTPTVDEAAYIAKRFRFVLIRVFATDIEELIRALLDVRVAVVNGFHGHSIEVNRIDSSTCKVKSKVEQLAKKNMPIFNDQQETIYKGKNSSQKKLTAKLEADPTLIDIYMKKTCCVSSNCSTCTVKCGTDYSFEDDNGIWDV